MKTSQACPKCQCCRIWHIAEVRCPVPDTLSGTVPMHVTAMKVPNPGYGRIEAGFFEAYVCAACGFTEWYAVLANPDLATMAQDPNSGVRLIDTSGQRGPFR